MNTYLSVQVGLQSFCLIQQRHAALSPEGCKKTIEGGVTETRRHKQEEVRGAKSKAIFNMGNTE